MGFLFKLAFFVPLISIAVFYFKPNLIFSANQTEQINQAIGELSAKAVNIISSFEKQSASPAKSSEVKKESSSKVCLKNNERTFTPEQLAKFDGSDPKTGIYLAFLGKVYDVEKGRKHYGPDGSYSMFAGRDASRAYISGDFSELELNENIFGLPVESYTAIKEWNDFYENEYESVGKVIGMFYDANGCATEKLNEAWSLVGQASQSNDEDEEDRTIFPPCNTEWNQSQGQTRVWCTDTSGGDKRDWVGKPRRLFLPKYQTHRCACVKDFGLPSTSSIEYADSDDSQQSQPSKADHSNNKGDLNNPRVSEFASCDAQAVECVVSDDFASK